MNKKSVFIGVVLGTILGGGGMFGFLYGQDAQPWVNYDEAKVPRYTLPDALKMQDGTPVATAEEWTARRCELFRLFADRMFGRLPVDLEKAGNHPDFVSFEVMEEDPEALGGKAVRRQVAIFFCPPGNEDSDAGEAGSSAEQCLLAYMLIYLPKNAAGPVPVFLMPNFDGNHAVNADPGIFLHDVYDEKGNLILNEKDFPPKKRRGGKASRWSVERILDAGFALATIYYQDIAPDDKNTCFRGGVFSTYGTNLAGEIADPDEKAENPDTLRDANSWGAIAAWAWGLSRAMDYLETDEVFDAKKVVVAGHSRLGKTALWAGACDTRFAIVISNNSGCGGAALSMREYGERVERINRAFPHWFCLNYRPYGDDVSTLPFDQHELLALVAPRPVYIASAEEDRWADPYGEFLAAVHAAPVYKLLGTDAFGDVTDASRLPPVNTQVGGTIGYHIRTGEHDVTDFDWQQYIIFAKKHFDME